MGRAHLMDEKKFADLVAELWRLRQERTTLLSRRGGAPMDETFSVQKKIQAACAELAQ